MFTHFSNRIALLAFTAQMLVTFSPFVRSADDLKHGPDSEIHDGVPRGKVQQQPK